MVDARLLGLVQDPKSKRRSALRLTTSITSARVFLPSSNRPPPAARHTRSMFAVLPAKRIGAPPNAVREPLPARPRVGLSQGGPSRCGTAVSCAGRPPVCIQSSFQVYVRTTTIGDGDTADRLGKYKDGCFGSGVGKGRVGGGRNRETGEHGGGGRGHVARGGSGGARCSPPPPSPGREGGRQRTALAPAEWETERHAGLGV